MWHHHPAPVEMWSHDEEEQEKLMRDSGQQGENENGNIGQIKGKCARKIRTRRCRPLDLLLLEARAFSVSAWGVGWKSWKRLQSESGKCSVRGGKKEEEAVVVLQVLDGCQAKSLKPCENNSRPCLEQQSSTLRLRIHSSSGQIAHFIPSQREAWPDKSDWVYGKKAN